MFSSNVITLLLLIIINETLTAGNSDHQDLFVLLITMGEIAGVCQ